MADPEHFDSDSDPTLLIWIQIFPNYKIYSCIRIKESWINLSILFTPRRFVAQESDLVRYKLQAASPEEIGHFMKIHDLRYTDIDSAEKNRLAAHLSAASPNNIRCKEHIFALSSLGLTKGEMVCSCEKMVSS